jgi:hypothetical protein
MFTRSLAVHLAISIRRGTLNSALNVGYTKEECLSRCRIRHLVPPGQRGPLIPFGTVHDYSVARYDHNRPILDPTFLPEENACSPQGWTEGRKEVYTRHGPLVNAGPRDREHHCRRLQK